MARTDVHALLGAAPKADRDRFVHALIGDPTRPEKAGPNVDLRGIIGRDLGEPVIYAPYRADRMANGDRKHSRAERHTDRDWLPSVVTGKSDKRGKAHAGHTRDMRSAPVGWGARTPPTVGTFPTNREIAGRAIDGKGSYPLDEQGSAKPLAIFELRGIGRNLERASADFDLGDPPAAVWDLAAQAAIDRHLRAGAT